MFSKSEKRVLLLTGLGSLLLLALASACLMIIIWHPCGRYWSWALAALVGFVGSISIGRIGARYAGRTWEQDVMDLQDKALGSKNEPPTDYFFLH